MVSLNGPEIAGKLVKHPVVSVKMFQRQIACETAKQGRLTFTVSLRDGGPGGTNVEEEGGLLGAPVGFLLSECV